jgi:hypothetical protein
MSDSTMCELERSLEQVRNESLRLTGLMEQSLQMTRNLKSPLVLTDIKSLEREMWKLERECRLFSSPQNKPPPSVPSFCPPKDLREELLTAKEELAELKRQVQHITKSPLTSSTFPHHSRQSSAEHHHHYYYYHLPEYSRELPPPIAAPAKTQDTPIHTKIFRELPTPPQTASSASSLSLRHERFNSSLSAWPQIDIEPDPTHLPVDLRRKPSHDSLLSPTILNTPTIKRSASHDSIFESKSTPRLSSSSPNQSPRSSPQSHSATSSPTYLSASAYLRQNTTSSLLLLSSARGKQSRSLSSRKSFWNLWDKSSLRTNKGVSSSLRNVSSSADLGRCVVCTEVDVGMLQDALDG